MTGPFHLHIPGIVFEMCCEPGITIIENHALYREFVALARTSHHLAARGGEKCGLDAGDGIRVPVQVTIDKPRPDDRWPVVFDSGDSWLLFRDGEDLIAAFPSATESGVFWWLARLAGDGSSVQVACDPEMVEPARIANPLHYPLDQILTMLILATRGGCIVHAAGVRRDGRGIACIGRSGAGKTTLMKLLEDRTDLGRLSDDRLILRVGDPALISGTPWAGEGMVAANQTADLAALVFLHQGETHELHAISPQDAAAQLLPTTSVPWFDEPAMTGCLSTLDHLVLNTPSYNLVFGLDGGMSDLIDQLF